MPAEVVGDQVECAAPQVSFRVPKQLHTRAAEIAKREGKSVSELGRETLEEYLPDRSPCVVQLANRRRCREAGNSSTVPAMGKLPKATASAAMPR